MPVGSVQAYVLQGAAVVLQHRGHRRHDALGRCILHQPVLRRNHGATHFEQGRGFKGARHLVSGEPAATMVPEQHGKRTGAGRQVDVQLLLRVLAIGDIGDGGRFLGTFRSSGCGRRSENRCDQDREEETAKKETLLMDHRRPILEE